ncbi:ankyrin repeat-containing domain, PGG domain protein [Tanacetum coccineum]
MDPSFLMAGSLNPLNALARTNDLEYLYASNANVSNFVSVKLSSGRNYHIWKIQMLCFMKSHTMADIVYVCPKASSTEIMDQYDSLLVGWIFGSASENVLDAVVNLASAKDVWDQLKSFYDTTVSHQQAVIHRSERIYNLIYYLGERKNLYRMIVDSSKNNILHLAGRLVSSSKLNNKRGAVLQLQIELQWCEEVKKVVFPTYITQDNIFLETPDIVFTREHENLVKDVEQWLKTTAESCSISAGLITTIVFAATITVPGGSNQDTGIPLFTKDIAFAIFAVSDAISLFASSTALLVFLSILTSRFAEKDFLISLPRRF